MYDLRSSYLHKSFMAFLYFLPTKSAKCLRSENFVLDISSLIFDANVPWADNLGCNLCQCIYLSIVTFWVDVALLILFSALSFFLCVCRNERKICIRIRNGWMEHLRRCKFERILQIRKAKKVLKLFFFFSWNLRYIYDRKRQMIKCKFYNNWNS